MKDSRFMFALVAFAAVLVTVMASAYASTSHQRPALTLEETAQVAPPTSEASVPTIPNVITVPVVIAVPRRLPKAPVKRTMRFVCDGVWHDSKYDEQKYQRCEWL